MFNYSAELEFPTTGDRIQLEAQFPGVDVFDFLKLHLVIRGTLPPLPLEAAIELPDYSDDYSQVTYGKYINL